MSLFSETIPALHGGVSQQSALVRAKEQLESLTNGWASLANGLQKRAPTETVAKLMTVAPPNAHTHTISRDGSEQYVVITTSTGIRVFDTLTGAEQTVTAPEGWGYLVGVTDFAEDVSMFTVADYTFVVNRKRVCRMEAVGADLMADPTYYAWVNSRFGSDDLGAVFGPGIGYQYPTNPTPGAFKGKVQRFDKLPETAAQGDTYEIVGDENTRFVSYYVRRNGGVWDETVRPGQANAIDAQTMPHALVRKADGTFKFVPFSWAPRRVGDPATNPDPGFIGRTIRKVFFYQNRLAFLYDTNVTLSEAGEFGNFYRKTVTQYLDSDVIDLAASTTKVDKLYDAVTFSDGILLTSDQTQFSLTNGEAGLSATSGAIRSTTNYSLNVRAGLAPLGSEIYFAVETDGWSAIREYSRLAGSDATAAADVTAHCPRYVPSGVSQIIPADGLDTLFVITTGRASSIFVYQFYWYGEEKVVSAWQEWTFGGGVRIVSGAYLKGSLFLLVERADGLFLERVNLGPAAKPDETDTQVHLDRRCVLTGVYSAGSQTTEFTVPFVPDQAKFRLVRTRNHTAPESVIDPTTYTWVTSTKVRVPGNETAGPAVAGESYDFRFKFSTQYPRKPDGAAITGGRLQLRTFTVSYRDTAYFKTVVAPYGSDPQIEEVLPGKLAEFTGRVLGSHDLVLNRPAHHTGKYAFQVYGENTQATIEISNDTHVGSTFVAAEWEGYFYSRSRV